MAAASSTAATPYFFASARTPRMRQTAASPCWRKPVSCNSARAWELDRKIRSRTAFRLYPSVRTKGRVRRYFPVLWSFLTTRAWVTPGEQRWVNPRGAPKRGGPGL